MRPADPVRKALDLLVVEKGEKINSVWRASFSVKDVLEKAGLPNTPDQQRYVIYTVSKWYEGCKVSAGQADNGGFLEMKVRSI